MHQPENGLSRGSLEKKEEGMLRREVFLFLITALLSACAGTHRVTQQVRMVEPPRYALSSPVAIIPNYAARGQCLNKCIVERM